MSTLAANLEQQFNNLKSRMSHPQGTVNNKDVEKYLGLFSECSHTNVDGKSESKGKTHIAKAQTKASVALETYLQEVSKTKTCHAKNFKS